MNLASNEYFKSIKPKQLDARIVTPNFKEARHGTYRSISAFAKKARGLMASYIIHNQLTDVEDAKSFDAEGYRFDAGRSSDDDWIFTRDSS
ncbi:MAG: peroxide stress protein YaaA, partial [Planctomycetes bacterium]|nr:peroxide stress protein YaaA [Planctomycetota bacterium]